MLKLKCSEKATKLLAHIRGPNFYALYLNFLKMKSNLQGMKKENHFQENRFWRIAKKRSTLWWRCKDYSHLFMINLSDQILIPDCKKGFLQVNLCQKLLFLYQLTHNKATDYSLNYEFSTWKCNLRTCFVHKLFFLFLFWHSEQFMYPHVLSLQFSCTEFEQSYFILWVS